MSCNQMEKTFLELLKVYSVFRIHPVSMTDKQPNILQRRKELNLPDRFSTLLKEVEVGIQTATWSRNHRRMLYIRGHGRLALPLLLNQLRNTFPKYVTPYIMVVPPTLPNNQDNYMQRCQLPNLTWWLIIYWGSIIRQPWVGQLTRHLTCTRW